jgi:glucan phosphoethanolaminetransferase (alkaline phosphatase superfamily)
MFKGMLKEHFDETARHTIERLEAFSDIIIGFCIAEMGLNLLLPESPKLFSSIWVGTYGFVFSFVMISILWWIHHRLFRSFFVLNTASVVLNFAMLGSLVLMVYFQQMALRFIAGGGEPGEALQLWMLCYGVVYGLVGAMVAIGLRTRWKTLSIDDLRWGVSRSIGAVVGTIVFFVYAYLTAAPHPAREFFFAPLVLLVAIRLVSPWAVERVVAAREKPA